MKLFIFTIFTFAITTLGFSQKGNRETHGGSETDVSPAAFQQAAAGRGSAVPSSTYDGTGASWIATHAEKLDADRNGTLDQNELLEQARTAFNALDSDRDGVLSSNECEGDKPASSLAGFLATIDKNHDSPISAQKFAATLREAFAKADSDHDGAISAQ